MWDSCLLGSVFWTYCLKFIIILLSSSLSSSSSVCLCVCDMCVQPMPSCMCVRRSEDDFMELVLSFYLYVGSGDGTQVMRFSWLVFFPLNHLTGSGYVIFRMCWLPWIFFTPGKSRAGLSYQQCLGWEPFSAGCVKIQSPCSYVGSSHKSGNREESRSPSFVDWNLTVPTFVSGS